MEASGSEKAVYGADAKLHPVTKMPLETGIGALSEHQQALAHVARVTEKEGKEAGEKMAKELAEHEKKPVKTKARAHAEAMAIVADIAEGKGKLARAKADAAKAEADAEGHALVPEAWPQALVADHPGKVTPPPLNWMGMPAADDTKARVDEAAAKAKANTAAIEAKARADKADAESRAKAEAAQQF